MRVVAGIAAHDPEKLVIPALQRTVAWQIAEMPFADQRGAVAGTAQQRRESRVNRRESPLPRRAIAPPPRPHGPHPRPAFVWAPGQAPPRNWAQRGPCAEL